MTGVYLAYAIDQVDRATHQASVDWIREGVRAHSGVSWVFDPGRAFTVAQGAAPEPGLRAINQRALETSEAVVAYLPAGVVSVGVPMEIDYAVKLGKKVLVVSDAESWMLEYTEPNFRRVRSVEEVDGLLDWLSSQGPAEESLVPGPSGPQVLPVKLSEGGSLPTRTYARDAGLDLVVSETVSIPPGDFRDVHCGASVELPRWSWGLITGRSSTIRRKGLLVTQGVIDEGYRGPLFAGVWNLTDEIVTVKKGERVAQLIVLDNSTRHLRPVEVAELEESERGERGFGSTGV